MSETISPTFTFVKAGVFYFAVMICVSFMLYPVVTSRRRFVG